MWRSWFLLIFMTLQCHAEAPREKLPTDWSLRVRVLAANGEPLAGVQAWERVPIYGQVFAEPFPDWLSISNGVGTAVAKQINWTQARAEVSGADGRLTLTGLQPPVGYVATLFHPGSGTFELVVDGSKIALDPQRIDLGDIRLPAGTRLRGVVRDPTGKPVPNAWVASRLATLKRPNNFGMDLCDRTGRWRWERVRPGRYLVEAGHGRKVIEVKAGEWTDAGSIEIERPTPPASQPAGSAR